MKEFNPDINTGEGIFGLPFSVKESKILIIPVSWDATTSYGKGASLAPEAIFNASFQLDLYREFHPEFFKSGIAMIPIDFVLSEMNTKCREKAETLIQIFENDETLNDTEKVLLKEVNNECAQMVHNIKELSLTCLKQGKFPVLLGGDHSVSLGLLQALSESYPGFGILQIDAHADLRKAYQGFTFSHASIMYNALELQGIKTLTQVGIRDFCSEEAKRIEAEKGKIFSFTDRILKQNEFEGLSWKKQCDAIVKTLPEMLYISFDIDGLTREFCPNTGTPVPGGLDYSKALYLVESVCLSGRKIIGFDVCEVVPDRNGRNEWDANVGARVLFDLCMYMAHSF